MGNLHQKFKIEHPIYEKIWSMRNLQNSYIMEHKLLLALAFDRL